MALLAAVACHKVDLPTEEEFWRAAEYQECRHDEQCDQTFYRRFDSLQACYDFVDAVEWRYLADDNCVYDAERAPTCLEALAAASTCDEYHSVGATECAYALYDCHSDTADYR